VEAVTGPDIAEGARWTKQSALADPWRYMDYLLDPDVPEGETTCRLVEGGGTPADYTRYYVGRYSRIAHLAPNGANVYGEHATSCGKWVDRFWLGTGSQDEYDRAAHLSTCDRCIENYLAAHRRRKLDGSAATR
jgi:hypothetical protein